MNDDDMQYIEKIITNETNESITNLTFQEIDIKKKEIIDELDLSKNLSKELFEKLAYYRYIDEFPELQVGRYIRWINITNPEHIKLTRGGILCTVKIEDNIALVIKSNTNYFFQINMEENLIFQRFSDQENIILYAIDYLNNNFNKELHYFLYFFVKILCILITTLKV